MIDKSTQLTATFGLSIIVGIAWISTDLVGTGQLIASMILLYGGYATFRLAQGQKLSQIQSSIEQSNKSSKLSRSELRQVIRQWSDREFNRTLQINWDFADRNVKPIFRNGEKKDEYICVTGAVSANTLQVFVLASESAVKEVNTVRAGADQYKNPFKYSSYWSEVKKQNRRKTAENTEGNITFTPGVMRGGTQTRGNDLQNEDDE